MYMRYTQGMNEEYSQYYPEVGTKPGIYYQGCFMYMSCTQGLNVEYL